LFSNNGIIACLID